MKKKSLAQQDKEIMKHITRAWCVCPQSSKTAEAKSVIAYGQHRKEIHKEKPMKMYEGRKTKLPYTKAKEYDDWRLYV